MPNLSGVGLPDPSAIARPMADAGRMRRGMMIILIAKLKAMNLMILD